MTSRSTWTIEIGRRIDGRPWELRVVEHRGDRPGPTTAFIGGMVGDKAVSILAVHGLDRELGAQLRRGRVLLIPALNLPGLSTASRYGPDHLVLNRRFPGRPDGFDTDQIAAASLRFLIDEADYCIDLHSGTPTLGLGYAYSFGDDDLAAAYGRLPVIVDHVYESQLAFRLSAAGIPTVLIEEGGGTRSDPAPLVEGCLRILGYLGQTDGTPAPAPALPIIRQLDLYLPSAAGILVGRMGPDDIGQQVPPGEIAQIVDVGTGDVVERHSVDGDGILLLASASPAVVTPGVYGFMIGYPHGVIEVPAGERSPGSAEAGRKTQDR